MRNSGVGRNYSFVLEGTIHSVWLVCVVFYVVLPSSKTCSCSKIENYFKNCPTTCFKGLFQNLFAPRFSNSRVYLLITTKQFSFEILTNVKQLDIHVPEKWIVETPIFEIRQNGTFHLEIRGFAPPHTTHYLKFSSKTDKSTSKLLFKETVDGYQRGFRQILKLRLPERYKGHLNTIAE